MNEKELLDYCREWLQAWTGNRPDLLISFYSENALYSDPARRDGLRGHSAILQYFEKLLAVNKEWTWKPLEVVPTERGCVLKWECAIPVGGKSIIEQGLDIVEISDDKITRNEVYFDRTALLKAIDALKQESRPNR
ncbi:MAG: nuclear transport factor 2 family protein [Candidatus Thorarchaeota archaeon]|nr:MAG: nuclear transport factor 2 family protein [Candidatus Thorarchaeota archaeon]